VTKYTNKIYSSDLDFVIIIINSLRNMKNCLW